MIKKLTALLVEDWGVDPETVHEGASLMEDLGADSLDMIEFVMAIEEEFGVDIADEDAEKWRTVGDIVRYLEGAGAET